RRTRSDPGAPARPRVRSGGRPHDARRAVHHRLGGLDPELTELAPVDRGGRPRERVAARSGLRERDDVADRLAAGEDGHQAVEPERDPAVRRRAVLQRLEQEAEAPIGLLLGHAESLEDLLLDLGLVDTDRAAAELDA